MKIGSVSWIIPGTYLENALVLEELVDFVELLIYTWDDEIKRLVEKEMKELNKLSLFYGVHLPTDDIGQCAEAYRFLCESDLNINHYVLHPLPGWRELIENRENILLENLIDFYPVYSRMVLDLGHLRISGGEKEILGSNSLKEVREIHMHGVVDGKDHAVVDDNALDYFRGLTREYNVLDDSFNNEDFLVNFEVFELEGLKKSIRRFKDEFSDRF